MAYNFPHPVRAFAARVRLGGAGGGAGPAGGGCVLARFFNSPRALTVTVVALALFAAHVLWCGVGLNIVLYDYFAGGLAFLDGKDPYVATLPLGPSNSFKYSPQFALLAGALARASVVGKSVMPWAPALWTLGSCALFALALCRWHDFARQTAPAPAPAAPPAWSADILSASGRAGRPRSMSQAFSARLCGALALAAAAVDFLVSTGVYQVNAAAIALVLLGLAAYRDSRFAAAGALLLAATNLKIYPIIFLAALALRFNKRFWLGAAGAGIVLFLLPAPFTGWSHNLATHLAWVKTTLAMTGSYAILDLRSMFAHAGLAGIGAILYWLVAALTLPAFFIHGVVARKIDFRPWFACGAAAILLISPKTEVFTYVFLAPAYAMMCDWCAESPSARWRKGGVWLFALAAVFTASARFVDPLWYKSENPNEIQRVIGALAIWGAATAILLAQLRRRFLSTPAPANEKTEGEK
jgi:hypothetical protein